MPEAKNILVGIDLSHADHLISVEVRPEVLGVVAQATDLARGNSAQLTFCAVIDLDPHTLAYLQEEDPEALTNLGNQAEQVLQGLVEKARAQGVIAVASTHAFGKSWIELIKQVIRGHHDLVMVGTRKLSGLQRLLLGSTGLKLLRSCPCPVWVARPAATTRMARILVADDLTEIGARLVRLGGAIAKAESAELHILHALEFPWDPNSSVVDPKQVAYHDKCVAHARAEIAKHLAGADVQSLPRPAEVVIIEELAENAILRYIDHNQIDLLVMATVARSGLSGFVMGNTAERLMPQLSSSVLAIKPDDFRTSITLDS